MATPPFIEQIEAAAFNMHVSWDLKIVSSPPMIQVRPQVTRKWRSGQCLRLKALFSAAAVGPQRFWKKVWPLARRSVGKSGAGEAISPLMRSHLLQGECWLDDIYGWRRLMGLRYRKRQMEKE